MSAVRAVDMSSTVDAATLLREMLAVPSVSGSEQRLARRLADVLDGVGFAVRIDTAGNVVAGWGEGAHRTVLAGHMDTVAGYIDVRREGDRLYGRGAVDAKGPLAAAITAVTRQRRDGGRRFLIAALVEEETTSRGARELLRQVDAPDELIVLEPSGWDGVTIGYKGSLRLRWSLTQPASHSAGATPSASDRGVEFVHALRDLARARSSGTGIFDRIDVRVLGCGSTADGLVDSATFDMGIRVPPGCDIADIHLAVTQLADGGDVCIAGAEPAVRTDRNSRLARDLVAAIRANGGSPRFKLKTGTSDLNILAPAWGCPAVAYGPGDSKLDHTADEHIDGRDLDRAVNVLSNALQARR